MQLVIVESPTKAKTISRFLGKDYTVKSSYGHVRDLPKSKLGVEVEDNFTPTYVIPEKAKPKIKELKALAKKANNIILATDEDREGEAIAWHLVKALEIEKANKKTTRIVFHEITKGAINEALKHPRDIDINLVDAQQARRVLDRLVGYKLSPFLWNKVARGLSAGRVQSVAVRLIAEREQEIGEFKPQEYWTIEGLFKKPESKNEEGQFIAYVIKKDGKSITKLGIKNKEESDEILENLSQAKYFIEKIERREVKKNPLPPFTTSTLQQESARRLGFSAKQTMMIAQQLYEGIETGQEGSAGLITYMRTDSLNLSEESIRKAGEFINKEFGNNYAVSGGRRFKTKSKGAQEAHEAIRPAEPSQSPESIERFLDARQLKLYNLIWRRFIASQMKEALSDATSVDIKSQKELAPSYTFRANGSILKFDGFLKVYQAKNEDLILPDLTQNESLELVKLDPSQHFTQPPPRYTEASLIKALEKNGIGRPSTYAPTMSVIQERNYVEKDEQKRFKATDIGLLVNDVLVKHFPEIVDIKFTANMEEGLDNIAIGKEKWIPLIKNFYKPFSENLAKKNKELDKKKLTEEASDEVCEKCSKPMIIKTGRFGKFLACTGYPDCRNTRPLDNGDSKDKDSTKDNLSDEKCELCEAPMQVKHGRYGTFLGCTKYPDCKGIKGIEKNTGVKCPECGQGDIVEKKSKRGKIFFACNQYPKCKFALWQKPNGEKCPKCKSLLTFAAKDKIRCGNKGCKYTKESEPNKT